MFFIGFETPSKKNFQFDQPNNRKFGSNIENFLDAAGNSRVGHNGHFSDCPPTLDDHNFFVRTPFRVFLNSMESPWSQDSSHSSVDDSG